MSFYFSFLFQNLDIGSIVSQRLTAMRRLQENPNDLEALNQMYQAQKDVSINYMPTLLYNLPCILQAFPV